MYMVLIMLGRWKYSWLLVSEPGPFGWLFKSLKDVNGQVLI